ncbi:MAG: hypothetical protein MUP68_10250, partial [Deltaproteobacteria bacterium]|nr:hypothetical protein [Deltaproteobacteria bacterium]
TFSSNPRPNVECTSIAQEITFPVTSFKGNSFGVHRENLCALCGLISYLLFFHKTFDNIFLGILGYIRESKI